MKKLNAFLASVLMTAVLNAAVIEQVIVRQQWPWSTDVKIEYKISAVTNPVDITVQAFNGATALALPAEAIAGDRFGISEDGVGTLVLDPVTAFGTEKVALANFKVKLTLVDSTDSLEILYKVFNLDTGSCEDITRAELLNGKYGTVETDYSKFGGAVAGMPSDLLIWTGVTNDIKYATTHLVLRRIPAGSMRLGYSDGYTDKWGGIPNPAHDYTITKPYYIGVFELTRVQFAKITKSTDWQWTQFRVYDNRPMESYVSYETLRGATKGAQWPLNDDVDEGSLLYKLRDLTGKRFDLPTENQWEYACRAGVRTVFYNGTSNTNGLNRIARYSKNGGLLNGSTPPVDTTYEHGTMTVGGYFPNAYGLYDMLGNVVEICRDWAANDPTDFTDDTMNPTQAQSNGQRVIRGSSWYYDERNHRAEQRGATAASGKGSSNGVRLMLPAVE